MKFEFLKFFFFFLPVLFFFFYYNLVFAFIKKYYKKIFIISLVLLISLFLGNQFVSASEVGDVLSGMYKAEKNLIIDKEWFEENKDKTAVSVSADVTAGVYIGTLSCLMFFIIAYGMHNAGPGLTPGYIFEAFGVGGMYGAIGGVGIWLALKGMTIAIKFITGVKPDSEVIPSPLAAHFSRPYEVNVDFWKVIERAPDLALFLIDGAIPDVTVKRVVPAEAISSDFFSLIKHK